MIHSNEDVFDVSNSNTKEFLLLFCILAMIFALSCPFLHGPALSYPAPPPAPALSCPALHYPVLSCLVLSYSALSYSIPPGPIFFPNPVLPFYLELCLSCLSCVVTFHPFLSWLYYLVLPCPVLPQRQEYSTACVNDYSYVKLKQNYGNRRNREIY